MGETEFSRGEFLPQLNNTTPHATRLDKEREIPVEYWCVGTLTIE